MRHDLGTPDLNVGTLRKALRAPSDEEADLGATLDVAGIMTQGRRLRHRRRAATVAGCLCAAGLLAGGGTALANLATAPPAHVQPASPNGGGQRAATLSSPTPSPAGKQPVPVRTATPAASPVPTGGTSAPAAPFPTAQPTPGTATTSPTASTKRPATATPVTPAGGGGPVSSALAGKDSATPSSSTSTAPTATAPAATP